MYLWPVIPGKALVCQDIVFGAAHQFREPGMALLERVDQLGRVLLRRRKRILVEGGSERVGDDRAVLPADAGQRVAHEMHAVALDRRAEHLGRGGLLLSSPEPPCPTRHSSTISVHYPWWTLTGTSRARQSGQTGRLPNNQIAGPRKASSSLEFSGPHRVQRTDRNRPANPSNYWRPRKDLNPQPQT